MKKEKKELLKKFKVVVDDLLDNYEQYTEEEKAQIKEILDTYKATSDKDTFVTLEPHLQTFSGLNALVGKTFDNPYKYPDQQSAFTDAVANLKALL